jgi:hypothetical protein
LDKFGLAALHQLKYVVAHCASRLKEDLDKAHVEFYEQVLRTWWTLGGELTRPTDGASGPFPRFFFAVVGPVMGEDQPSRLSLRDIVKTYEERPEDRTYRERQEDCRGK